MSIFALGLPVKLALTSPVRRFDYVKQYPTAIEEISKWIADGTLKRKFHIVEGLTKAPEALPLLFTGGNTGKLYVQDHCILWIPAN